MADGVRTTQLYAENIVKPATAGQVRVTQIYVEQIISLSAETAPPLRSGAHQITIINQS